MFESLGVRQYFKVSSGLVSLLVHLLEFYFLTLSWNLGIYNLL